jgi:hypothetical protein
MAVAQAAWTTGAFVASGTSVTSGSATLTSGSYGIAYISFDSASASTPTVTSVTDSASGTWVQIGTTVYSATFGTGKPAVAVYIRTTIGTGTAITVTANFSSSTGTKSIATQQFSGTAGLRSGITSLLSTSTPGALTTPTSSAIGDMYLTVMGVNDTTPSGWSGWTAASNTVTTSTNENVYMWYLAASSVATATTGTGNQTGNTATSVQVAFVLYAGTPASTNVESWGTLSIN